MANILKWFSDIANNITGNWNLSEDAMFALTIGLIIVGVAIALAVFRFIKKAIGKTIAVIVLVAILTTTGFISTAQLSSFAEKIGVITQSSVGEGLEINGQAFLDWIESKMPGKDEGAGSWVPDKDNQDADDWHEDEDVEGFK